MFEKHSFYVLIRKMYGMMWRAVTNLSSYVVNRMLQIVGLPMVSPRRCAQDTSTPTPYHKCLYRTSFLLQYCQYYHLSFQWIFAQRPTLNSSKSQLLNRKWYEDSRFKPLIHFFKRIDPVPSPMGGLWIHIKETEGWLDLVWTVSHRSNLCLPSALGERPCHVHFCKTKTEIRAKIFLY